MSTLSERNLCFLKDLETQFRGCSFKLSGVQLSADDVARVANAYALWAACVADLRGWCDLHASSPSSELNRWRSYLCRSDIKVVSETCKTVLGALRLWDPTMGAHDNASFKHWLSSNGVMPGDPVLGPIWPLIGEFRTTFKLQKVNTALCFISRLTLKNVDWVEEHDLQEYIDLEGSMREWVYSPVDVRDVREQAMKIAMDYHYGNPSHSNGATAEVRRGGGLLAKWKSPMTAKSRIFLTSKNILPTLPVEGPDPFSLCAGGFAANACVGNFVPKGLDRKRFISMEPTWNMFAQAGISEGLDRSFRLHPEFGVNLHKQELNCDLCIRASRNRDYATIDMSSASDSVTLDLVKQLLDGTTLLRDLLWTRSTEVVLPHDVRIKLAKFAPMGSRCCFPVECLVFSSIVRAAQKRAGTYTPFRVYGDDLLVHESCYDEVIHLLNSMHFQVNDSKSYAPHETFKESCGIEVFNGIVCTPCRLSRRFDINSLRKGREHPTAFTAGIDELNKLDSYGLKLTRAYLLSDFCSSFTGAPFCFSDAEVGIRSSQPTNYHLRKRRNEDLQCSEMRTQCVSNQFSDVVDDERYLVYLLEYHLSQRTSLLLPDDRIEVNVGATRQSLEWDWQRTPEEYFWF